MESAGDDCRVSDVRCRVSDDLVFWLFGDVVSGNWKGVVDLSGVRYDVNEGKFVGEGIDKDEHTGEGDRDEPVGSGKWNFDNVKLIKPSCPEQVNLFFNVNGDLTDVYHKETCPISEGELTLQWKSEGVEDECNSIAGPWELITRPNEYTGTGIHNTSAIDDGELAVFKLRCIGRYSGTDVIGTVKASCGETCIDCGPNSDDDDDSIIAPKLIEA